jgi:NAD(P)H-flavin reductase
VLNLRDFAEEIYRSTFWQDLNTNRVLRILDLQPGQHLHVSQDGLNSEIRGVCLSVLQPSWLEVAFCVTDSQGEVTGAVTKRVPWRHSLLQGIPAEWWDEALRFSEPNYKEY